MASSVAENKDRAPVAKLETKDEGQSLWADAWKRLIRNRAAMMGLFVIIAYCLLAVFANVLAPKDYATQVLEDNNGAPEWIISMFPTMTPRDENFRIARGWEPVVTTGESVKTGTPLVEDTESDEVLVSNMDGTAFIDGTNVVVTKSDVSRMDIPAGGTLAVEDGATVITGDALVVDNRGVALLEAPFDGKVYLVEDERIVLRSMISGYVPVRNNYTLGADGLGRDLLSRLIYGARVSLLVAFVGPLVSFLIGVPFGLIAGYSGGRLDNLMMRFIDVLYGFPTLLLIILLMAFFRSSFGGSSSDLGPIGNALARFDSASGGMLFIFVGIGLTSWMQLARLTRGQVLSAREADYVIAAESLGLNTRGLMFRHIFPNILGPIVVAETLTIPTYIRFEAFLSFIGLGVNPPTPSWGAMISEGANVIRSYPNQALFSALMLFLIMFAFNFLGDGLRDALDPRMRGVD
ncbi:MAG: ABC transporter permease [Anaerolineae bacterium]|nr:ABC transporter permease [Anaerolineae bacterium]